ncbi:lipolytic protein G-D-S-L family [Candidatus Vecturithrix granuli]|uniref:Lipolytic protein G-D-S-L family n=1 Tax=Vecturithrix granuli TaxID=1499967 RepID=A0A081C0J6_VECG1|nr:lipolytic protein G-D-S-L family [Candidatus Vecturithrix granuli]
MNRKSLWIFIGWVTIAVLMIGCKDRSPGNPVETKVGVDKAEGILSDDTSGSAIDSPQYPEATTVIIAIGDSITYGQGASGGGYPSMLQEKLLAAGYTVVVLNAGIRGERAYSTHERWLQEIADADIALLMIGINDLLNPGHCHEPYDCHTAEYIEAMINEALISKKIPLVSTVTPAKTTDVRAWVNPYIRSLNARIESLATQYNIPLVDNYQAIRDNGGDALYSDHVHFSDTGYNIIAQQWFDAIVNGKLIETARE